jgi:hypothetical protein
MDIPKVPIPLISVTLDGLPVELVTNDVAGKSGQI